MVIGSRIRERDKKNEEYYVGDYLISLPGFIFRSFLQQFLPDLVLMVLEISVQPEPDLYPELNVLFLLELL